MRVIRLGREDDNDFIVSHPMVSGHHGDIYIFDNGAMQYFDHSTNGTRIDGKFIHNSSCLLTGTEIIILPGDNSFDVCNVLSTKSKADTDKIEEIPTVIHKSVTIASEVPVTEKIVKDKSSFCNSSAKPRMFSHVFSFRGRIRRLEYNIVNLVLYSVSTMLSIFLESTNDDVALTFILLSMIPLFWIQYAEGAKRCHDLGHSGWFQIIPFYPFVMVFCKGESGTNEYGDNPKGE